MAKQEREAYLASQENHCSRTTSDGPRSMPATRHEMVLGDHSYPLIQSRRNIKQWPILFHM
jgi:hypothetical protein